MKPTKPAFSVADQLAAVAHALRGLAVIARTQRNVWIELVAAVAVVVAGVVLQVDRGDWCWIALAIALVLAAESFNTALEFLADAVTTEFDERIGRAKDAAAGAVLLAAAGAAVIGALVFWPYL